MYTNLVGELVLEPKDVAKFVLESEEFNQKYRLMISRKTKMGFSLHSNFGKPPRLSEKTGIYAIYRGDDLFYIGATENSIHNRVARFLKEVLGNSTIRENHPAATKFRRMYGEKDLDRIFVSAVRVTTPNYMELGDVEKELIRILNPIANKKR
jgi:hypothetical protein